MNLILELKRFLHYNDIWYFHGFAPRGFTTKRQLNFVEVPSPKDETPKHIVKGRTFQVEDNGEWVRRSRVDGTLVPYLTKADWYEINESIATGDANKKLNHEKYLVVKNAMLMDDIQTAMAASLYLSLEYKTGYGIRTIEKYWAAIRRAISQTTTPLSE